MRSAGARVMCVGHLPQRFCYLGRFLRVRDHLPQKHRLDLAAFWQRTLEIGRREREAARQMTEAEAPTIKATPKP
jgi:hypothetical protein